VRKGKNKMQPYYDHAGITIYHGDCREIVPQLGRFDLLLTDPPYGVNYQSNMRAVSQKMDKIVGDSEIDVSIVDVFPTCKCIALFSRWNTAPAWAEKLGERVPVRGQIIWHKACGGMGDLSRSYSLDYEAIVYATSNDFTLPGKRHGSVWKVQIDSPSSYQHPTQKPVGIMSMCIERFLVGETILDPFMGSGTTLRAAKNLNRKAVGIEINEQYCEIAASRMSQEVLAL
jgi:site-specific DNA-methyltransferase (adenine-specific)